MYLPAARPHHLNWNREDQLHHIAPCKHSQHNSWNTARSALKSNYIHKLSYSSKVLQQPAMAQSDRHMYLPPNTSAFSPH